MDLRANTPPKGRRDSIIESAKSYLRELPQAESPSGVARPCGESGLQSVYLGLTHGVGIPENSPDTADELRIRQRLGEDVR